jgi:2-polyprenyl-3-methyl-5-hydroxy-6-metoxy-1,4-benzoquinol methylase
MTHDHCLVCSSDNIHLLKGYERHQLGRCKDCGFTFMLRIPGCDEIEKHYSTYTYNNSFQLSQATIDSYNRLLNYFEKFRVNNNILDVGCGRGLILEIAGQRGWNVYGSESSDAAIKICEEKGIKMFKGDLNSSLFDAISFDVIISSEVIEHVHDFSFVKQTYSLLRRGGLLYLTTPNFNSYLRYRLKENYSIIAYPDHLSYFTRKTLHFVLRKSGLKKVRLQTTGISINRMQSNKVKQFDVVKGNITEEKIRHIMNHNYAMKIIKDLANKILTITGLGMTIKAYYIKL